MQALIIVAIRTGMLYALCHDMEHTLTTFRFVALLSLALSSACSFAAVSPPGRTVVLEGTDSVGRGRVGIQGEAGVQVEDVDLYGVVGRGRVRIGITDDVQVSAEGNISVPVTENERETGIEWSAGFGAKLTLHPAFAIRANLLGGRFVGGGFISPSIGLITGFNFRHVSPFGYVDAFLSAPLDQRDVRIEDDSNSRPQFDRAALTVGMGVGGGLRVSVLRNNEDKESLAIVLAAGMQWHHDLHEQEHIEDRWRFVANLGFELTL